MFNSECAENNHASLLSRLLAAGSTPQPEAPRLPFECAVHWAIRNYNVNMLKDLLSAGADVEVRDGRGCTAIMIAGLLT